MSVIEKFRERHPNLDSVPLLGEPVCLVDGSEIALFDAAATEEPRLIIYELHGEAGKEGSAFLQYFEPFVSNVGDGDFRKGSVILASERIRRLNDRLYRGE